jgi:polysaccharide lyase-like protein
VPRSHTDSALIARFLAGLAVLLAILLVATGAAVADAAAKAPQGAAKADGNQRKGSAKKRAQARRKALRKRRAQRARARANRHVRLAGNAAVDRPKRRTLASTSDVLDAGFEQGLLNWNTAGVGETLPTVVNDVVRTGGSSGRVLLTGTQHRSELILGGTGGGSTKGMIEFHEGDEAFYAFSFYIDEMEYGRPGAHNLIMQFKGDDDGSPAFGLQLWDYEGDDEEYEDNPRGLWSHGPSMGGDRFLALAPERTWHDVVIHFRASAVDAGFYEVYLDGRLVDSRSGVSMIADGASYAYIKCGLYRNGDEIPGTSEIRLDAARLGPSLSAVAPS